MQLFSVVFYGVRALRKYDFTNETADPGGRAV
jgi:hypothetical protein